MGQPLGPTGLGQLLNIRAKKYKWALHPNLGISRMGIL